VLRWAVVGTGRISETFVPDIQSVAGNRVTAVWGRRTETVDDFAVRQGIPFASTELGGVLARDDVDIVYLATPIATHRDIALQALDAGKHVLIEKPIAASVAEAREVFDAARARDRFAMEAMWMKFNPLHREVVRLIGEGLIGEPRSVRGGFGMPFPPEGSRWSAALGGSTVLDQGIYPVTLAEWVLGTAQGVVATGRMRDGVDVTAQVTLDHGDGRFSQLACSVLEFADPSASLSGTAGWIEIPAMFWATDRAELHACTPEALFRTPEPLSRAREGNGYVPMIREVAAAVDSGLRQHPWHDAAATLATAGTLEAIRRQIVEADAGASVDDVVARAAVG